MCPLSYSDQTNGYYRDLTKKPDIKAIEQGHSIVIFDGVCVFCSSFVRLIIAHDPDGRFVFTAVQSDFGTKLFKHYGLNPEEIETVLLVERDKVFQKSDAIFRITGGISGPWKFLGLLVFLPKALRNYGYTVFARNRYAWFGRSDQCMIPQDDLIDRFIA